MEPIPNHFIANSLMLIFLLNFLEHLGAPWLGTGAILPPVGILIAHEKINAFAGVTVCLLSGILASFIMYFVGYFYGEKVLRALSKKSTRIDKLIKKATLTLSNGNILSSIGLRLVPVARTVISLIEGSLRINFFKSAIAIIIGVSTNIILLISLGYFLSNIFI